MDDGYQVMNVFILFHLNFCLHNTGSNLSLSYDSISYRAPGLSSMHLTVLQQFSGGKKKKHSALTNDSCSFLLGLLATKSLRNAQAVALCGNGCAVM